MSWWTKNRKKAALAAGLLGASFIPGAPAALSGLLGGLFPSAAAGGVAGGIAGGAAGAAGAGTAEALGSAAATELAKTGTLAALEGGGLGSGASLAGTGLAQGGALGSGTSLAGTGLAPQAGLLANAPLPFGTEQAAQFAGNVNPQFFNPEMTGMQRFGDSALAALKGGGNAAYKGSQALGAAKTAMSLVSPEQQMAPPPPPPSQFQPTPVSSPYGMSDQPPPGVSARDWAMMTPEMKRRLKGYMA